MRRFVTIIPALLVFSFAAYALEPGEFIPEQRIEEWQLGYAALTGDGVLAGNKYLLTSFSRMAADRMKGIKSHVLSDREKEAYRISLLEDAKDKVSEKIDNLRKQRDRLVFSGFTEEKYKNKYRDMTEEIKALRNVLLKIADYYNMDEVDVPEILPLIHRTNDGDMMPPPFTLVPETDNVTEILENYAAEHNLEALLWGVLQEVQGYLILELHLFNRLTSEDSVVFEDAGLSEDIPSMITAGVTDISERLLGRRWSSLTVIPNIDSAEILINKKLMGFGETEIPFVEPGVVEITVRAEGYREFQKEVDLEAGTRREIKPELESIPQKTVTIRSAVPADVYFKSLNRGPSPEELTIPEVVSPGRVIRDGYKNSLFIISSETQKGAELDVPLVLTMLDPEKEFQRSRRSFYRSLGFFAVSVPIPLVLNGIYQNYALGYYQTDEGTGQRLRFANLGNGFYYGYLGGIFASGVLLVNTVIKLINLIDTAAEYHSRVHQF